MSIAARRWLAFGMLLAVSAWGCPQQQDYKGFGPGDEVVNTDPPDHGHAHVHGPHDGHIVELGHEEYHAEVVFDAAARKLTVYLLGADVKTPQLLAEPSLSVHLEGGPAPVSLTLNAEPLEGEADGQSSRFSLSEGVPETIKDIEDVHGEVVVTIADKQYKGEIGHDHAHAH